MIDFVERRGQISIQCPHSLGPTASTDGVDGLDRVMATPARAKPIRFGFEPGLPFRFQCGTNPALMTAIRYHGNPERAEFRTVTRLGYVDPLDRSGAPRRRVTVHLHRPVLPGRG